ncbi:MAG: DUF808 domain-containing protein [Arachnia sp.]
MAGGLAALLDDVAMIAKMTSAASSKAVGVVIDDAAVTPRYVHGFSPARELPIIWKIAKGSLANKAVIIVALLLLTQFAPWILTPILMVGGCYLVYEGAEKLWEFFTGHGGEAHNEPVVAQGADQEATMVRGAITTDFVLSAEIMMISLNEITLGGFLARAITLVVVAVVITALVYGVVALIVKMDDIGLDLTKREPATSQRLGAWLVGAMPKLLSALSAVGVVAMLWVGGHILLSGSHTLGWHAPYALLHHITEPISHVAVVGGGLAWLVDTLISAAVGFVVGSLILVPLHWIGRAWKHAKAQPEESGPEQIERDEAQA